MTKLYNPHEGLVARDGGPYLDQEEAKAAETLRAAKEGREPDYDNPGPTAATRLVPAATLVERQNTLSNPSQRRRKVQAAQDVVDAVGVSPAVETDDSDKKPAKKAAAKKTTAKKAESFEV